MAMADNGSGFGKYFAARGERSDLKIHRVIAGRIHTVHVFEHDKKQAQPVEDRAQSALARQEKIADERAEAFGKITKPAAIGAVLGLGLGILARSPKVLALASASAAVSVESRFFELGFRRQANALTKKGRAIEAMIDRETANSAHQKSEPQNR
jgi:hypothetical protein